MPTHKEFRRILNDKAQPAGSGIFGTPVARKANEEQKFASIASLSAWHEPLLFLVEKLRDSAPDTRTILTWTFPQLAIELTSKDWMPLTAAQLLARISLDQEVALDDFDRNLIWRLLWRAQIASEPEIFIRLTRIFHTRIRSIGKSVT